MKRDKEPEGNETLTSARNYIKEMYSGGDEAPAYFKEFAQLLLSKTIMDSKSHVCIYGGNTNDITLISGPRRRPDEQEEAIKGRDIYHPLKLNDGNFLYLFFENFIDRNENNWLKTNISKMAYQLDSGGHKQLFRFDYNRLVKTRYASSHVHVYGSWRDGAKEAITNLKDMHKIHFPVVRPTIEGLIRILVDDFGVKTNTERDEWEPVLEATEKEFKEVMSKKLHRAN